MQKLVRQLTTSEKTSFGKPFAVRGGISPSWERNSPPRAGLKIVRRVRISSVCGAKMGMATIEGIGTEIAIPLTHGP